MPSFYEKFSTFTQRKQANGGLVAQLFGHNTTA